MPSLQYLKLGHRALGRMALGRTWHWADFFPGRGRFGTLLSHPALLLATGNRGLSRMDRLWVFRDYGLHLCCSLPDIRPGSQTDYD
jgi:hypothetical protein